MPYVNPLWIFHSSPGNTRFKLVPRFKIEEWLLDSPLMSSCPWPQCTIHKWWTPSASRCQRCLNGLGLFQSQSWIRVGAFGSVSPGGRLHCYCSMASLGQLKPLCSLHPDLSFLPFHGLYNPLLPSSPVTIPPFNAPSLPFIPSLPPTPFQTLPTTVSCLVQFRTWALWVPLFLNGSSTFRRSGQGSPQCSGVLHFHRQLWWGHWLGGAVIFLWQGGPGEITLGLTCVVNTGPSAIPSQYVFFFSCQQSLACSYWTGMNARKLMWDVCIELGGKHKFVIIWSLCTSLYP